MCKSQTVGGGEGGLGGKSSVYLLNCSVCKGEFNCRHKWMEHLTLDDHQNLARECLLNDLNNLRECSLVIFTTYDITVNGAGKIIQYFAKDQSIWVTDFLWWEDRPRFAVVQFESRKKVEQVVRDVESLPGDLIQIDDTQRIQVKGAFDLLDLEWKAIFPGSNPTPILRPSKLCRKSAKESEASIFTRNDVSVSNNFIPEVKESTEVNLVAAYGATNYLKRLYDLAEEREWEPPTFKLELVRHPTRKKTKRIYTIFLNGEVYRPHYWFIGNFENHVRAKQASAKYCLQALKSREEVDNPENIPDGDDRKVDKTQEENSNIELTDNPVEILKTLSHKLYGISPEFKVAQISKMRKYFCRVVINGKIYTPRMSTGKGSTVEEAKLKAAQHCLEQIQKDDGIKAQECLSTPQSQLNQQFTVISEFVQISEEKCELILEIVRSFRDLIKKRVTTVQVTIFRNWYLKLRNSSSEVDPLLIYVYAENGIPGFSAPPSGNNFTWIPSKLIVQLVKKSNGLFLCKDSKFPNHDDPKETRLGFTIIHQSSGFQFTVVNYKRTLPEVQCSRLVKYFCEFDPRIRPLLILARYWLITNGIHWGEPEVGARKSHQCLPQPHSLDWMILTFLMEKKCVPSLRSVLERPHKVLIDSLTATDVGFHPDMNFAREWKGQKCSRQESADQLVLNTLQLFQNFLEFCCTRIFNQGGVIINPKDGEILETSKVLGEDLEFTSKLTTEEISVLKNLQENSDKKIKGKYCVNFREWNWYMINPLITNWRFSVPDKKNQELITTTSTEKTNERLKNFLKLVEKHGAEKAFEICGASLCEILKVDNEISALDPSNRRLSRKRRIDSI